MSEKAMGALNALQVVKAVRGEAYAEGLVDMANILAPQREKQPAEEENSAKTKK